MTSSSRAGQHGEVPIINHLPPELVRINVNYVGVARHATSVTKSRGVSWYTPSSDSVRRFTMYFDLILWLSEAADGRIFLEPAFDRERLRLTTAETFCAATRTRSPA